MRHKITVYKSKGLTPAWYAYCACGWEPGVNVTWPDGSAHYGRPNWDAALAVGVAHLKNADLMARLRHAGATRLQG